MLKCYNYNSITTNEKLKHLTHMFYFRIPCDKPYKQDLFSYVFTLKYMCHLKINWKKKEFNPKEKHKKNKIHGYFLVNK
jgi:hypothetical protein